MYFNVPYKTKQFFFVLIKLSIVVGAFYFIYSKLVENENFKISQFWSVLIENKVFSLKNIIFLLILSIFNWFFEILKWQKLVRTFQKISIIEATKQAMAGLTTSLITPNRIGEYAAKTAYYRKQHRKQILLLNLLGNMAQMSVTTVLGIIGLIIFVNRYQIDVNYYRVARFGAIILLVSLFTLFGIKQTRFKIRGYSIDRLLDYIKDIPSNAHLYNIIFALIRYAIFSFQFYVLLLMFGVDINYLDAMILITSMYLLASIIPTISIFDVIIKGSVAVYIFGIINMSEVTVLSIILIMWFLNFALPSLLGSYFVLKFKFPKA